MNILVHLLSSSILAAILLMLGITFVYSFYGSVIGLIIQKLKQRKDKVSTNK